MSFEDNCEIANSCSLGLEKRLERMNLIIDALSFRLLRSQKLNKAFYSDRNNSFHKYHNDALNRDMVNVRVVLNPSKNNMKGNMTGLSCLSFEERFFMNNRNN